MENLQELSLMSLGGMDMDFAWKKAEKLDNVQLVESALNELFSTEMSWNDRQKNIKEVFEKIDLTTNEVNRYTFFDPEKAYTRNLIARDPNLKHYTLLLLCWNAGKESKIHNHPCDGCFVKTIRGCIRETRYHEEQNRIQVTSIKFFNEGQVSFMDDNIGYHKISNPYKDTGAVSLHLYTPPFSECKVWSAPGSHIEEYEIGKVGFYSMFGNRTPHLEGKPGSHARLLSEIRTSDMKTTLRKIRSEIADISA